MSRTASFLDGIRAKLLKEKSKWVSKEQRLLWQKAACQTILAAYFYVFMDWLFLITKPSFMQVLPFLKKVEILFITAFWVAVLAMLPLVVIFLLERIIASRFPVISSYILHLSTAFILACFCLIWVDNFTYSLFQAGVFDANWIGKIVYALGFLAVFYFILCQFAKMTKRESPPTNSRIGRYLPFGLLMISLLIVFLNYRPDERLKPSSGNPPSPFPNIILIGLDGVNADHMSAYGYELVTTPFLHEFAKTSLTSLNHFTNSAKSLGSITSLLTGKSPFATKVLYSPDILMGADRYQHLPGILKSFGYYNVQIAYQYYLDANVTNFHDAFDVVNGRQAANAPENLLTYHGYGNMVYFLDEVASRIGDRLAHIFFIKTIENPYKLITSPEHNTAEDQRRLSDLFASLQESERLGQPLFAQIHLMGTHGPQFYPTIQTFSSGIPQDAAWMPEYYDDSILEADTQVKKIVEYLQQHGQYDNTIIVIFSDHGQQWTVEQRLPLLIHFPDDQFAGSISVSSQNMDIAPTLLDFLGLPRPNWTTGTSLLGEIDPLRVILAGDTNLVQEADGKFGIPPGSVRLPFYKFTSLYAIQCQKYAIIDLVDMSLTDKEFLAYKSPCTEDVLDQPAVLKQKAGLELQQYGYSLPLGW